MRLILGRRTSATTLVVAAIVMWASAARAHSPSVFFHGTWAPTIRAAVPIYAETNLRGTTLTRALQGAKTWDALGESLDFSFKGTRNLSRDPCDRAVRGQNLIGLRPLDGRGGDLAMTTVCRSGASIVRFVMVFDSAEDWYVGTSTTVPRGRPDLLSVAVHEFGHAAGWAKHYDDPGVGLGVGICGNFSGQHTMCATHYASTARQRSLGPHDVETFRQRY